MRVAIIADIRLHREGLAETLGRQHGIDLVATATTSPAGIESIRRLAPDVTVVEIATLDSISILRKLTGASPDVKVVIFGLPETEPHVLACAEQGIAGFVPQNGSAADLVDAVRGVFVGEVVCSPLITGSLFRHVAALALEARSDTPPDRLTFRETEIVELLGEGLTNREIAARLHIQLSTVKNHVHNVLDKLHLRRRSEAAEWAAEWLPRR